MKISFDPPRNPERIDGINVPYGIRKRLAAKWRWYLVLLLVLSPLLYFAVSLLGNAVVLTAPGVASYKTYILVAPVSGYLQLKPLRDGDRVGKWQLLGTLQDERTLKRIGFLENLLEQEKEASSRNASPGAASAAKRAEAYQREYLARIRRLMEQGAATRAEYNEAQMRYETALSQLSQLQAARNADRGSMSPRKELESLERTKETPILSPDDGILLNSIVQHDQYVVHGASLLEFAQTNTLSFTVYLSPAKSGKAVIGKNVTISFANGQKLAATVDSIKPLTEKIPSGIKRDFFRDEQLAVPVILRVEHPPENVAHNSPFTVRFW